MEEKQGVASMQLILCNKNYHKIETWLHRDNMIFVDDKRSKHNESTRSHATNIKITSTTRHKKRFSMSNIKVKARTTLPWSQEAIRAAWHLLGWNPRIRGGDAPRVVVAKRDDVLFTNIIGYIFIVRRLGKQYKLMCPYRTLSLTQSELNLRIHGPHGPNADAGADS